MKAPWEIPVFDSLESSAGCATIGIAGIVLTGVIVIAWALWVSPK